MIRAERIHIDTDEGRFILIIEPEDTLDTLRVDIHDHALALYTEVRMNLGPYIEDAARAMASMPQPVTNRPVSVEDAVDAGRMQDVRITENDSVDPSSLFDRVRDAEDAYLLNDPKHPTFHDRYSELD